MVDLSGTTDTAKRGSETDTLIGIEGAIGSTKADRFKGDARANEFQGGRQGHRHRRRRPRHLRLQRRADSPPGASKRDVITDFAPGQDVLDLAGIDADPSRPGNQTFRWVGTATDRRAGQLGYVKGGITIVRASTDADAAPELEIQLTGTKTLTEDDVRL